MIDYYEYIISDAWYARTEQVRKRNNGRCECCLMRAGHHVHHITYANLGEEKDEDLIHLCRACHEFIHGKSVYHYVWPSRQKFLLELRKKANEQANSKSISRASSETPWG